MQAATASLHQPHSIETENPGARRVVSVVLPARNEEENIRAAVASLAQQPEIAEIVVVDDQSTDGTPALLRELAGRIPHLRILRNSAPPAGWVGKSHALATGVRATRGEWLLLTDADVCHRAGSLRQALALAAETGAALVSFSPDQEMDTWWERAVLPRIYCALAEEFNYEAVSDPASPRAAANGQYLLIRRDVFEAVGGRSALQGEILDDVALARRVKQAGYRLHFAGGAEIARTRMYRRFSEMWRGWTKNLFPLFGGSSKRVAGMLAMIAILDVLPALVFSAAVVWQFRGAGNWLFWLSGLALGFLLFRHAAHARALRRNRFPLSCIWYYLAGSAFFAALLLHSRLKYRHGWVEWKGRKYAV